MNVLAKEAGVGVGTVYRHFPNRQVLLDSLAIDAFERLTVVAEEAAADPDAGRGLERLFVAVVAAELDDLSLEAVLTVNSFLCPESTAAGRALISAATPLLRRGVAEGPLAPDIEPVDIQNLLSGTVYAVRVSGDRRRLDRYVTILLRGLKPGPSEADRCRRPRRDETVVLGPKARDLPSVAAEAPDHDRGSAESPRHLPEDPRVHVSFETSLVATPRLISLSRSSGTSRLKMNGTFPRISAKTASRASNC